MNKVWKYVLLVGVAVSMTSAGEALGSSADAVGMAKTLAVGGYPVEDITSVPAHAIIAGGQGAFREGSKKVKKQKEKIRERLSVSKKQEKQENEDDEETENEEDTDNDEAGGGGDDAGDDVGDDSGDDTGDEEDGGKAKKKTKVIDAKLSKIKIKSNAVTDEVGEGIVGEGVNNIITTQGKQSSKKLVDDQQKKYISAAGTEETQAHYEKQRQYNEQEQAVQMIAYAATVRQNVSDTIEGLVDKVESNYKKSGGKKNCDYGCVKRDLDPKNKNTEVHKNADYNQVLRQYAYYSLIYDQLLSLEQQIIGLRLQAKGALSEQRASVLSDVLDTER